MSSYILHSGFHLWLNSRVTWENLKKKMARSHSDQLRSQGVNKTHSSPPNLCTDCSLCLESRSHRLTPLLVMSSSDVTFSNGVSSDLFKLGRTFTPFPGINSTYQSPMLNNALLNYCYYFLSVSPGARISYLVH